MVILEIRPYNTYFRLHQGYLGQLVVILGIRAYNTYYRLHHGYIGQVVLFLEIRPYNTYFKLHQEYQVATGLLGHLPTYFYPLPLVCWG